MKFFIFFLIVLFLGCRSRGQESINAEFTKIENQILKNSSIIKLDSNSFSNYSNSVVLSRFQTCHSTFFIKDGYKYFDKVCKKRIDNLAKVLNKDTFRVGIEMWLKPSKEVNDSLINMISNDKTNCWLKNHCDYVVLQAKIIDGNYIFLYYYNDDEIRYYKKSRKDIDFSIFDR